MSARFIKYVSVAGKQIAIYVASEIQHAGFRRLIDAIEPSLLSDTVNTVEHALQGSTLLSAAQVTRTRSITITFVA